MSVYIIAEAGINHNGKLDLAKRMVDVAKEAGADCVKFQTFVAKDTASSCAKKADYQEQQTGEHESQVDMLRRLKLSFDQFVDLKQYCEEQSIEFLSTPFDFSSIDFLRSLGMEKWKIPSGEITNLPYLIKIAKLGKAVILSTGMSTMEEVSAALVILKKYGSGDITALHCTTEYPTPFTDVNLNAMKTMREEFNIPVGYSDHTNGIEVPIAAVAMGAVVIEKHFTLDRNMEGPDHKASLEPDELKAMVSGIRNVELALGNGKKEPVESELKNIAVARKSLVAKRRIVKGDVFSERNLTVKRPGNGISPMRWFEIIGQTAMRDFQEDELIEL